MTNTIQLDAESQTPGGFLAEGLQRIDHEMALMVERGATPGMVGLVYRRGEIAKVVTQGWQDIATRTPMRRDTIFHLMSMTKPITAAAVMILVSDGVIRLSDPVETYLPELADRTVLRTPGAALDDVVPAMRSITVEDLLTYRCGFAGFPNPMPDQPPTPIEREMISLYEAYGLDPTAWLERLASLPLETQPGAGWTYHTGSEVQTILVERASGMPYTDFLQTRIFDPLGMKDTGHFVPADKWDRYATAYQRNLETRGMDKLEGPFARLQPTDVMPPFPRGGIGLVSTVDDYLMFARMLLGRGKVDGVRILDHRAAKLMTSNYLTTAQRAAIRPPVTELFEGQGWGLGVSIVLDVAAYDRTVGMGSVGTFGWPGAMGTWWQADPEEDMVQIYMHHFLTLEARDRPRIRFQELGYEAIDD